MGSSEVDLVWFDSIVRMLSAVRAKGNGFIIGSSTAPDVMRWDEFLLVRLRVRR